MKTVFIIGGGPSVNDVPISYIQKREKICVNSSFKLFKPEDDPLIWFGDYKWFLWNKMELRGYSRIYTRQYISGMVNRENKELNLPIRYFKDSKTNLYGIDDSEGFVSWNGNSGASAINVAYHMGFKEIVLIGFDLDSNKEKNFHTEYKGRERNYNKIQLETIFNRHRRCFKAIKKRADLLGIKIWNTSLNSSITDFDKRDIGDFL